MAWLRKKAPPVPMTQQAPPYFQWVDRAFSSNGHTGNMAFESERLAWKPLVGPGVGYRFQFWKTLPMPANLQAQATVWTSGIGGVQHGQTALQPLSNPYGS